MRVSVYTCDLCEGPIERSEPAPAEVDRVREEWHAPDVLLAVLSQGDCCVRIHACTSCLRAFVRTIKAKHLRIPPELSAYEPKR